MEFKKSRYLRDIAWQVSGNGIAQVLGIAAMPLLTRIYAPENFAIANTFLQIVGGIAILITWRLEYFVMLAKSRHEVRHFVTFIAFVSGVISCFLTVLISINADKISIFFGNKELADWLFLAPVNAWLLCMAVALQQAVQYDLDFKSSGISEVASKAGYVASALAGFTWVPSMGGLIASNIVGATAKCIWLWHSLKIKVIASHWPLEKNVRKIIQPYIKLSASTSFASCLSLISGIAPLIFIGKNYGQESLGQFSLVVSTLYLPSSLLGSAVGQVYYQRASHLYMQKKSFYRLWKRTSWQLSKIGFPLFILIGILSPLAYPFIFGGQWCQAGDFARIMAISAGLSFLTSPMDRTSLIVRAWWYQIIWNALRVLFVVSVIYMANSKGWAVEEYLLVHMIQMSVIYIIDWLSGMLFARLAGKDI